LECAQAAGSEFIITGDQHLLHLGAVPLSPVVIFLENASGENCMPITRRHFLQQGAAAAVALATTPSLLADPLGLPIGCQTYPVRASINPDFAGTMKGLSAAGFQTIELCSPFGYKDFSSLAQYKPQELRRMLHDYGLTCISAHFDTDELFHHAEERIAWAKDFGLTQMATASLGFGTLPKDVPPTVGDVNRITDLFNTFAAKAHDAGIVAVLHNEGFEVTSIDGKRVYDGLLRPLSAPLYLHALPGLGDDLRRQSERGGAG
jgi:hypothetical protein